MNGEREVLMINIYCTLDASRFPCSKAYYNLDLVSSASVLINPWFISNYVETIHLQLNVLLMNESSNEC